MKVLIMVLVVVVVLVMLGLAIAARIVKQYERGVLFRFGRVQGPRNPGFRLDIRKILDVTRTQLTRRCATGQARCPHPRGGPGIPAACRNPFQPRRT